MKGQKLQKNISHDFPMIRTSISDFLTMKNYDIIKLNVFRGFL